MANSNRFWKGMVIGAVAGGALSLLDKDTRTAMKGNWQKVSHGAAALVKNPSQIVNQVKQSAQNFKTSVEQVGEDLSFIAEKVEELRETTPQVTQLLKETKETFTKKEQKVASNEDLDAI